MISIRQRLTRELLAATLLLLGGGLVAVYFAAREAAVEQFDDALRAKAYAISTLTQRTKEGVRLSFSDRFFRGFDNDKAEDFFVLWDRRDKVLARSEAMPKGTELPRRIGSFDRPQRWNLTLPNGRPGRAIGFRFKPRGDGGDRDAEAQLVVATVREDLDDTLGELLALTAGSGALLLLATLLIIPRVLRRGLRPLDALGDHVTRIDATSLGTRLAQRDLPAELHPIAHRLNALLARLEASFERERRFSADLAHELRTPLAELRSAAECALKWPETREPAIDRETVAVVAHMERIVTHILALSRSEQGQLAVRLEPVELHALVSEVWRGFAARALARGLDASLSLSPTNVIADAALLRAILVNLCENAVDYAPPGGELRISIESVAGVAIIHIANTTADFDPADVAKLFDRFWRKESARTGGQHTGLGLSVAQAFAHTMNWTLTAALNERRQLVFTLTSHPI